MQINMVDAIKRRFNQLWPKRFHIGLVFPMLTITKYRLRRLLKNLRLIKGNSSCKLFYFRKSKLKQAMLGFNIYLLRDGWKRSSGTIYTKKKRKNTLVICCQALAVAMHTDSTFYKLIILGFYFLHPWKNLNSNDIYSQRLSNICDGALKVVNYLLKIINIWDDKYTCDIFSGWSGKKNRKNISTAY